MMLTNSTTHSSQRSLNNYNYDEERVDLACSFRWAARFNWHEAVANHFSLAVNEDGSKILLNPNKRHFSLIKASDLLLLDVHDKNVLKKEGAPDETAWGLHAALHRVHPHIKCAMHVHSIYATVLACLENPHLPPIDQNTAIFYNRYVIDSNYGGLAFEDEGERCAKLFENDAQKVMIMGNHGVMVTGSNVADTFNRLYYFERAAETYIKALSTGKKLNVLSHDIAEKTAREMEDFSDSAEYFFKDLKEILEKEDPDFKN